MDCSLRTDLPGTLTMQTLLKDKLFIALAVLFALTLFSWLMLYAVALSPKTTGALLLLLAFVKVQIVISRYMELDKAIVPVRIAFWMWTIGVCAMTIISI